MPTRKNKKARTFRPSRPNTTVTSNMVLKGANGRTRPVGVIVLGLKVSEVEAVYNNVKVGRLT